MKILHRYVYFEVLKTFFVSIGLLVITVLMDRASSLAQSVLGRGISFFEFASILLKTVPAILGITLPLAFVVSVLMVFLNMNANNEIIAVKSCGISIKELLKPLTVLGFLLSVFCFFILMFALPKSNVAVRKEMEELIKKKLSLGILEKNFSSNFPGITFYSEKTTNKSGILRNFMVNINKKNQMMTIFANVGKIRIEKNSVFLDIQNGTSLILNWNKLANLKVLHFQNYTVKLYTFTPQESFTSSKYKNLLQLIKSKSLEAKVEIYKRLALSFAPIIVGLVAFSIAILLPRGSYSAGIILGVATIVGYYVLYTFFKKTALKTGLSALPLLTDIIFSAIGLILIKITLKEKPLSKTGARW